MTVDMARGFDFRYREPPKIILKHAKQRKKMIEVESGWPATTLRRSSKKLGFFKLESLQALSNEGLEVEETLVLVIYVLDYLIKN